MFSINYGFQKLNCLFLKIREQVFDKQIVKKQQKSSEITKTNAEKSIVIVFLLIYLWDKNKSQASFNLRSKKKDFFSFHMCFILDLNRLGKTEICLLSSLADSAKLDRIGQDKLEICFAQAIQIKF